MSKAQFEYWRHTHIILDVVVGYAASRSFARAAAPARMRRITS